MTAADTDAAPGVPVIEVADLVKVFPVRRSKGMRVTKRLVQAVSDVSFAINKRETLGLVGESGSGKSTLGRCVLQLIEPSAGSVKFQGRELVGLSREELRPVRREVQMVFQDPYASLDPRLTVGTAIEEPLQIHKLKVDRTKRVRELLELVGLSADHASRYPHEFSGGQRQRVGIARALALDPTFLVLDEPVSALDVSIQAGVINLLEDLQDELDLTYLFIAHDLSVVRHISDFVAVMYLGKLVEVGPAEELYTAAAHPYTQALLSAIPEPDPVIERQRDRITLTGDIPSPIDPPSRVPVPHPLPEGAAPLRHRGAGAGRPWLRTSRGVPLPGAAPRGGHPEDRLRRRIGKLTGRARRDAVPGPVDQRRRDGRHGRRDPHAQRTWWRPLGHVRRWRRRRPRFVGGRAEPDPHHHGVRGDVGVHRAGAVVPAPADVATADATR